MFSFLKKNSGPPFPDKVWRTRPIAWKEITTEALRVAQRLETPIVVGFFPRTLHDYENYLMSLNVPTKRPAYGEAIESNVLYTADASALLSDQLIDTLKQRAQVSKLCFLFLGHHPLLSNENNLIKKLSEVIGNQMNGSFWLSFDDPLLTKFGSEKILPLLDKLGMKEDECVEHTMVSKSISNAREKISKHVRMEITSDSEEEWFERNFQK
jgi:hypothetical protein